MEATIDRAERRARLRSEASAEVNGLDYLEVLTRKSGDAVPESWWQRYLAVVFVRPLDELTAVEKLRPENVRIDGGDRIESVDVDWLERWEMLDAFRTYLDDTGTDLGSASPSAVATDWADHVENNMGWGSELADASVRARFEEVWRGRLRDASFVELLESSGPRWSAFREFVEGNRDASELEALAVVRVAQPGDFSTYRFSLVAGEREERAPTEIDPLLATLDLYFKVDCERDVDCASDEAPEVAEFPAPRINYLAKDYESFRRLMLDRLSQTLPDWRDRTPADVGMALVETMAYAADQLSYYQDAVATESYLETARSRRSVRRHARLLDYYLHDGCNARAFLHLEVSSTATTLGESDPRSDAQPGLPAFLTRVPGASANIAAADYEDVARDYDPEVFEVARPVFLDKAHNEIPIHDWGLDEFVLPEGATSVVLRDGDTSSGERRLRLRPGDVLIFEQVDDPAMGEGVGDPSRRHAVRLTDVNPAAELDDSGDRVLTPRSDSDPKDPVEDVPLVEVEWAAEDALPFDLDVTHREETDVERGLAAARGNIALVDHGRTMAAEELPSVVEYPYRPTLSEGPVTQAAPLENLAGKPASATLTSAPDEAVPEVTLYEGVGPSASLRGYGWEPVRDLLSSGPMAREFVVEVENDGSATLRFGDDTDGRRPIRYRPLTAQYRVGNGEDGNVPAGAIRHVVADPSDGTDFVAVRNPLPARGGVDPEPIEQVKRIAPHAYRRQERAVTLEDYAEMAQRHDEVRHAVARRSWTGSWYTIFVAIDRKGGRPVDPAFERTIRTHLESYRLAGDDVEIEPPIWVPLELAMVICVESGYFRRDVEEELEKRFSNRRLPNGRLGFFHPDRLTFGEPIHLSEVVAAAMDVDGVGDVIFEAEGYETAFRRLWDPRGNALEKGRIAVESREIARLDDDPDHPERGTIRFFFEGGR